MIYTVLRSDGISVEVEADDVVFMEGGAVIFRLNGEHTRAYGAYSWVEVLRGQALAAPAAPDPTVEEPQ